MKALTLHQPWASLVAMSVKRIETRSWSTSYRGPLAIHAAKEFAPGSVLRKPEVAGCHFGNGTAYYNKRDMPLGAIVASCQLVDVVPTDVLVEFAERHRHEAGWIIQGGQDESNSTVYLVAESWQMLTPEGRYSPADVAVPTWHLTSERPYGDFTPGRYAWLLEDIKPTTERCPACWPCDEDLGDRICGSVNYEQWAEDDRLRQCVECAHVCAHPPCAVCADDELCDPIPARGRQGLWNWEPA